ncbi:MAG: excinuclease ABC subunit UvrC [Synergistaceae bacterium]|jgi:excinuclease ABC subunit C|nr:excinuclease ABC subunit UvrC [Synergistaceae bacterium]
MKPNIASILKSLPDKPGVYIMRDEKGEVLYVGKAKRLKRRVTSYFRHSNFASPRLRKLVELVEDISTLRTETEAEALIVESKLIRRYSPFFNIDLKMSDRYPYIRITNEPFPRLVVTRKKEDDGSIWFGPYISAGAIRTLLRLVERYFPLRSCKSEIVRGKADKRPCLEYSLGHCMGVCANLCTEAEYRDRVNDVALLLQGNTAELVERTRRRMDAAAKEMAFEEAARYRDTIRAIWKVSRQRVSEALQEDLDSETWQVLTKLQETFGLKTLPWRIDAFDISHMAGREMYGCCVVFEQGRPNPSLYRRFKIRSLAENSGSENPMAEISVAGNSMAENPAAKPEIRVSQSFDPGPYPVDDFRAIQETVLRRYRHSLDNAEPLPQFIVIDGGPVQLEFSMKSFQELKLDIPVVALAKREELVYRPGLPEPLRLSFDDPVLKLLQRLRDEVHRYSITTHRNAKVSRLRRSVLEEVPGIGKARAAQLIVKFGSVQRIAMMNPEELSGVPGVGKALAKKIISYLRGELGTDPKAAPEDADKTT